MNGNHASKVLSVAATWRLEDVLAAARGEVRVALPDDAAWRESIERGAKLVEAAWREERVVYGVTTGYGASCDRAVPAELAAELPDHLISYHGCGLGAELDAEAAAAVVAVRLRSLSRGYSGVRVCLLERLADLLNHRVLPVIPEEGSVGASGDLTPLSYLAAVLQGQRDVLHEGLRRPAAEALAASGLSPLPLRPKEALAVMNGTSVMTALACLAWDRAHRLAGWACRITAMSVEALHGSRDHFDERVFAAKPHAGTSRAAAWIRADLDGAREQRADEVDAPLQEPYSVRCAPHVVGVLWDSLQWMREWIEIEVNSANDNPLVDSERGEFLHGGNFYGGHMAFAMDGLKTAVASVADLLDRQLGLLLDEHTNRGLPSNLSGAAADRLCINHGFKAVHIATSAWTAEALKLTMPAGSFSRSTECHNQDKVSMGTIAARDALRVLELTEQVAASCLVAVTQALSLREVQGSAKPQGMATGPAATWAEVSRAVPFVDEDRPLDQDLKRLLELMRSRSLEADEPVPLRPPETAHA